MHPTLPAQPGPADAAPSGLPTDPPVGAFTDSFTETPINPPLSEKPGAAPTDARATPGGAAAPGAPLLRPTLRFLLAHPAHFLALGCGAGLARKAPGTIGSLWAWAAFLLINATAQPSELQWGLLIGATLLVGTWASQVTARHMGVADPGAVVIDEVVGLWLVLWLAMPMGFWGQLLAFGLFRWFDAAKPGPVAWADRHFKGFGWRGAWGIMLDDLVAAFMALLVLAVLRWWGWV